MTIVTPASPLDEAILEVRSAQTEYDFAEENHVRLSHEAANARVHRDAMGELLASARNKLFEAAVVKPTQYIQEPVRVAPTYVDQYNPLEEGVDAAWSENGTQLKDN